jgi:hypothetical protein
VVLIVWPVSGELLVVAVKVGLKCDGVVLPERPIGLPLAVVSSVNCIIMQFPIRPGVPAKWTCSLDCPDAQLSLLQLNTVGPPDSRMSVPRGHQLVLSQHLAGDTRPSGCS